MQVVFAFNVGFPAAQPVPLHPVKIESGAAVAVSRTAVPLLYELEQTVPQLMVPGLLMIVPAPSPDFVTVSV